MSLRSRARRQTLRAVKRTAGPSLAAAFDDLGRVADDELVDLHRRAKTGEDLGEAVAALDAVRRLRPRRDKFEEFRYWFKPSGEQQTIRLLDHDGSAVVSHEHRADRMRRWFDNARGERAHFIICDDEIKPSSPRDP